jgi:hypothetical protein
MKQPIRIKHLKQGNGQPVPCFTNDSDTPCRNLVTRMGTLLNTVSRGDSISFVQIVKDLEWEDAIELGFQFLDEVGNRHGFYFGYIGRDANGLEIMGFIPLHMSQGE